MTTKYTIMVGALIIIAMGIAGFINTRTGPEVVTPLDPTPQNVTLSGVYECLPHLDATGPQTEECAFGLKTDEGIYYAINFGAPENAMQQFQAQQRITAEGNVVIKEALSTNMWEKYNMKGIFTITKIIDPASATSGKINIDFVCRNALSYMTFQDAKSAEVFVAECKAGKHPEVIEDYKAQMNLGDGAQI